jgi:hypothetical protein
MGRHDMLVIIALSVLLASGILSVILSCALDANWIPLAVVLFYLLAPLPNAVCTRIQDRALGEDLKVLLSLCMLLCLS